MDLTLLATWRGMEAAATEAQILARIDFCKCRAECAGMPGKCEKERRKQEIENLLAEAVETKRITADVKDDWKEMLMSNFERAKKMLDALKPATDKPHGTIRGKCISYKQLPYTVLWYCS